MIFLSGHFAKLLDEVHDVGSIIHVVLERIVSEVRVVSCTAVETYIPFRVVPGYRSGDPHPCRGISTHNALPSVTRSRRH